MARALALLEGILLFAVACGMIVFWKHAHISTWLDGLVVVVKGLALSLCCIVSFYYNDLYDFRVVRGFGDFASRLLQSFGVAFMLLAGFYTIFPKANIAGGPFVSSLLIVVGLLLPLRALSYGIMRSRRFTERVLVVGRSPICQKIIDELTTKPHFRWTVVGVVDDTPPGEVPTPHPPILGSLRSLGAIIRENHPDRIIVALADRRGRMPVRELLEARSRRIIVEDGIDAYERLAGKLAIESLSPSSLIFSRDFLKSRLTVAIGRAISFLVALVGLLGLAPLFGLIALAIKLDSRGSVFFVQKRVGLHGKVFTLVKFRTMHPANGETSEWVGDNTHRITRLGGWLRKFRLDELPQFVNILRGDMNLVGPRPHPVSNYELFVQKIPYYTLRSVIRPGATGWAQVRYGYADNLQEETEKMRYDLYYIKLLSFWFDLRILLDTLKILLFGRGTRDVRESRADITRGAPTEGGPPDGADGVARRPRVEQGVPVGVLDAHGLRGAGAPGHRVK